MKRLIIFSFVVVFNLYACNNYESNSIPEKDTLLVQEKEGLNEERLIPDTLNVDLMIANKSSKLILKYFNKSFDSTVRTQEKDKMACANWSLTKEDIRQIFKNSKSISGTEWDLSYVVLPCFYSGEVELNDKKGKYELNAGSYAILKFSDTAIYLGFSSGSISKKFLSPPNEE